MKRVLVTGANGFLGRHCIVPLLDRGFEVHAVSRRPRAGAGESVVWHRADLLESGDLTALLAGIRPSHLLHIAWDVTPGAYWRASNNLDWLAASVRLLEAFAEHGGRRALGTGTCAEYEWGEDTYSEAATPLVPASLYGRCKLALSHAFVGAADLGLSAAWGRLFFPYGPGEHPSRLVPTVVTHLLARKPVDCTEGRQVRDFIYVADAAAAMVALLDSAVEGPVNIGSGRGTAVREMIERIVTQIGPGEFVRFGARPVPADEPAVMVADIGRLTDEVGYRPETGPEVGLALSIDWWRDRISAP